MRPEDLARLAALEELHTEKAVSLAANWPGDEPVAFHHAGIVLALREARKALAAALAPVVFRTCDGCAHPRFCRSWCDGIGRCAAEPRKQGGGRS